ncbi:heparanase-like [Actinia tenebrosa]|uniref:Heparanase-like n=1 Tax=Actinia tenebrosa TaxID=6105 RepID=A0A6P8HYW3_ACTTE|nr:heparanase-like [Actinia tenebrosa]
MHRKINQALIALLFLTTTKALQDETTFPANEETVFVNTMKPVNLVSEKYLSVAMNMGFVQEHWKHFDFSSPRVFTLARGLSPAYLRFGGTAEDWLHYKEKDSFTENLDNDDIPNLWNLSLKKVQHKNFTDYDINGDDLDKMHFIGSKAGWDVLFGLNVCLRTKDGKWDYSNPLKILDYVGGRNYSFVWELGNEPNHLGKFNRSIDAESLGDAFNTLRSILDKNPHYGDFIVGPDTTRPKKKSMNFLKRFLSVAVDAVDAITWHQYYFDSKTCKVEDFYDPEIFDYLLKQLKLVNSVVSEAAPNKRHWIGETATAWGGGAAGLSSRYIATLSWLDKLGLAARLGVEVVIRQTFFHGDYALLDDQSNPVPNYWLSLLHKRLVGQKVLDVENGLEENRVVRIYAHCTNTKPGQYATGAVTILAINLDPNDTALLNLKGKFYQLPVDQYLLSPHQENITSEYVELNGEVLLMKDDHILPSLNPVSVPAGKPLALPPLTLGLFVVPNADAEACLE